MRRGERFGWIVIGLITAMLVLMATSVAVMDYVGTNRVQACREGLPRGGDAWEACSSRSSFRG